MAERITSGPVSATLDQARVIRMLDRLSDGAASRFTTHAEGLLSRVEASAEAQVPVRYGTLRDGFRRQTTITDKMITVELINDAPHARFAKFSRRLQGQLDPVVENAVERFTAAAKTDEGKAKIEGWVRLRNKHRSKGAPSAELAGQHVWTVLVQRPVNAALPAMVDKLTADLLRLAGG